MRRRLSKGKVSRVTMAVSVLKKIDERMNYVKNAIE
jgi:hypothetical protein